jgi:hypothetical protein
MNILKEIETIKNKKNKEINKILNINLSYTISFENNKLILLNDNNDKILVSEFIFFGIYQPNNKLWIWSNSIPGINKNQIEIINDIKNKSFLFENNNNNIIQLYYQFLNSDVLEISDKNMLKSINDLFLYLTDVIVILNPVNKYGNVQYIGITKILEKYF